MQARQINKDEYVLKVKVMVLEAVYITWWLGTSFPEWESQSCSILLCNLRQVNVSFCASTSIPIKLG